MKNFVVSSLLMGMMLMSTGCIRLAGYHRNGEAGIKIRLFDNGDHDSCQEKAGHQVLLKKHRTERVLLEKRTQTNYGGSNSAPVPDFEKLLSGEGKRSSSPKRPNCLEKKCELIEEPGPRGILYYCRVHKVAFDPHGTVLGQCTIEGERVIVYPSPQ